MNENLLLGRVFLEILFPLNIARFLLQGIQLQAMVNLQCFDNSKHDHIKFSENTQEKQKELTNTMDTIYLKIANVVLKRDSSV